MASEPNERQRHQTPVRLEIRAQRYQTPVRLETYCVAGTQY
jgi:hypothetical protein